MVNGNGGLPGLPGPAAGRDPESLVFGKIADAVGAICRIVGNGGFVLVLGYGPNGTKIVSQGIADEDVAQVLRQAHEVVSGVVVPPKGLVLA